MPAGDRQDPLGADQDPMTAVVLRARLDALRDLVAETERALAAHGEPTPRAASAAAGQIVPLKTACAVVGWKPARLKAHAARFANQHPGQPPFAWQAGGRSCPWVVHLGRFQAYLAGDLAARAIRNHQRS